MCKNIMIAFVAGVAAGYVLDKVLTPTPTTTTAVKGVSLACECSNGSRCNSGKSDCSCCPGKRGALVPRYLNVPVQMRPTVGAL